MLRRTTPMHTYQILTKRPDRLMAWTSKHQWLCDAHHIWLGVSVEDRKYGLPRIDLLRLAKAAVRFLSIEPLLEDLGRLDLRTIDWVIVGGESGHHARPMEAAWVRAIRDECIGHHVPFFFKQWGGTRKKRAGRILRRQNVGRVSQYDLGGGCGDEVTAWDRRGWRDCNGGRWARDSGRRPVG